MSIKDLIKVQKVKEHKDIKSSFLHYFDRVKAPRKIEGADFIKNTDYELDIPREYLDLFTKYIIPYTYDKMYRVVAVNNLWFQQYEKDNFHGWHCHGNSHFSHIYYVELPNKNQATEFYFNKVFKIEVKEGDLITFPSFLIHRSPPNKINKRKSVVSFNTTFDEVMTSNIKKIN